MAGQSMRDIKRRIQSIQNTQQITKAMEMVSAAKLRRAQARVVAARPFADKLDEVLQRLVGAMAGEESEEAQSERLRALHPLLATREARASLVAVISADRGLAGGYNANVLRAAQETLHLHRARPRVLVIGRKGRDYFRKSSWEMEGEFVSLGDDIGFLQAREIGDALIGAYAGGQVDLVKLVYNRFVNPVLQRPTVVTLLPISSAALDGTGRVTPDGVGHVAPDGGTRSHADYIYEPSAKSVLGVLLPRYVHLQVYRALLEAKASEHAARMTAMRSASKNAEEMVDALTLSFNRARQAGITREIAEIMGGAEALAAAPS
ncbi:MAG: ATP synthase F1 subunit gamma [Firmicutes bacterium]|nr:ATP synthase F1 subunit gamma [Bacillota bacterium]